MKCTILMLSSFLAFTSCVSKPANPAVEEHKEQNAPAEDTLCPSTTADDDQIICTAIKNFLRGKADAAVLTRSAKASLTESTWPEVYCSVEGMLDTPSSFVDLTVRKVGEGQYKYECVCPDHGDRYIDCCTIHAVLDNDGVVKITRITWDDTSNLSVGEQLKNSSWYDTGYGFSMPNFMTPSTDIFVDDVPGTFQRWTYDDLCMACWPDLGAWAVDEYPKAGCYLTEDVHVKNVTYRNSRGTVFSGYATDGRIWYMKKKILVGEVVDHASLLILIYPKAMQDDVKPFIDIVKNW